MTEKPQTPAPDWDARARETIALCDHDWSDAERHIAAALRSAHASGLSETTAIAQRWRNDMAEACACIAERYEAHGPAADMRAMIRSLGAKE